MKALKIGNLLATVPIVQGGMGVGISLSGLASAVANQGGVGVISSAGLGAIYNNYSKDYRAASIWGLKEELRKAREATRGIVGVNVMVAMSNFADMVKTAVAEKADIIFSGAGLPLNLPSFLTEGAKTKLAPIVSSARAAKLLCQKWFSEYKYIPDAIVVEGPKAGGHLGYKEEQLADEHFSLEALVPEIVAEVRAFGAEHDCHIPVIEGGEPVVIANAEGARTTPSVVGFTKTGERLVGQVAKRQAITNPDRTIASIKRHMGTDYKVDIDGKKYTPQEISAMILAKLKADAESYLGEKVTEAGITEESKEKVADPAYSTAVGILLKGAEQGGCAFVERPSTPASTAVPGAAPRTGFIPPQQQPGPKFTSVPPRFPQAAPAEEPAPAETRPEISGQDEEADREDPVVVEPKRKRGFGSIVMSAIDKINKGFSAAEDEEI